MSLFKENSSSKKIKVKICGLARKEDISFCYKHGVDAIGLLIGNPKGKFPSDKLNSKQAKELSKCTPKELVTVALIKSESIEEFRFIINEISPDAVQIQSPNVSSETLTHLKNEYINIEWIKTVKIQETDSIETIKKNIEPYISVVDGILLDSAKGGSGKVHDWNLSKKVSEYLKSINIPVILAGGLKITNVEEAIRIVNPDMIDLMTGVSVDRGIKDTSKIKELMTLINTKYNR